MKMVGTRAKSARRERVRRSRVRGKGEGAGGRALCGPVPVGRANPGFRLGRKPFVFFRAKQRTARLKHHLVCSNTTNKNAGLLVMFVWVDHNGVFNPIGSRDFLGRLGLGHRGFFPRGSCFSCVLWLVAFFPARSDFVLVPPSALGSPSISRLPLSW